MVFFNTRWKLILPIIFIAISLCRCATAPRPKFPTEPVSLTKLYKDKDINTEWDMIAQSIMLNADGKTARLRIDSDIVILNEQVVKLSAPVKMIDSEVIVPPDFMEKIILPLTVPARKQNAGISKRSLKVREIVIDAGHGGKDPGAISASHLKEKDVVLDIAKKTAALLRKEGFNIKMTRDRDEFISLERRTELASSHQIDMFISIHANANPSRAVTGVEVYVLRPQVKNGEKEQQIKKNYKRLFNDMQIDKKGDAASIIEDMLDERKSAGAEKLANNIAKNIARTSRAQNRGVKEAGFFVLRNTLIPAVLIEVGYLSNSHESALLRDSGYREKIAKGIVSGIVGYLNEKN